MTKCIIQNIHTGGELEYKFDVLPRIGETIMIDGVQLSSNEDWQLFAGADENDPNFENLSSMRTYSVVNIVHSITNQGCTDITLLLDEFNGETTV